MKVLITGANGFVGKNLTARLREINDIEVLTFLRGDSDETLYSHLSQAEAVVHLAGENRPQDPSAFERVNAGLTEKICRYITTHNYKTSFLFASSRQVDQANDYGKSKLNAESHVSKMAEISGNSAYIYRLPGVFGKWCRPNYNSVVATFCHNIVNGLPIQISDPDRVIQLVYVDDVVADFINVILNRKAGTSHRHISPEYSVRLGDLAKQLHAFQDAKSSLISEDVGDGFVRALYSTFVSYYSPKQFSYTVPQHVDARGAFVEMLKTKAAGQFSFFTAHPGVTRGGHYHHSKTEKFLVIKGLALFKFRHILTNETYELHSSGDVSLIVETIPGWTHDITNVGSDELIVMLWANEIFDRQRPDTIACKV